MNMAHLPSNTQPDSKSHLPNPVMVSRQIDSLREVMRRMRTSQTSTLEALIDQKLQKLSEH